MKFSCDQCSAQYMIADEKVGAKGVKVKCKKCAHIIIVKPQTADEPAPQEAPADSDAAAAGGAGFGDMFGGSPFNEPTQAMSQEQLASLAASTAGPGDADFGGEASDPFGGLPPAAADQGATDPFGAPAADDGGFGGMTTDGGGDDSAAAGGFPDSDGGFPAPDSDASDSDGGFAPDSDGGFPAPDDGGFPAAGFGGMPTVVDSRADSGFGADPPAEGDGGFGGGFGDADAPSMADLAGQADGGDLNLDALGAPAAAPAPSSRPAGEREWYVAVDESQIGPIDLHEIEARWDGLEVDEDSLAWKAGMQDWVPIAEIDELAYLITERPQASKPSAGAFSAATTGGGGVGVGASAAGAGLGPVAFGGETAGPSPSDVSWTPSAASALSSLVQDELTATPAPAVPAAAPVGGDAGVPSFGASDLFGGGNGGTDTAPAAAPAPVPAMPPVAPAADPFAGGGGAQWSMPKPETGGGGLKPIHLAFAGMGLLAVGLVVVLAIVLTRTPTVVADPAGTVASTAGGTNTPPPPAGTTTPGQPGQPAEAAGATPTAPTATPPTPAADDSEPKTKRKRKRKGGTGATSTTPAAAPMDDILETPRTKPSKKALEKDDIMSGVKKGMGAVMGCIKTARAKGELAPGRHTLVLEWTIQPSGKVASPKLKGPSNVLGTSLPACFARGMRKWSFPSTEKGGPVRNFPFGPFSIK